MEGKRWSGQGHAIRLWGMALLVIALVLTAGIAASPSSAGAGANLAGLIAEQMGVGGTQETGTGDEHPVTPHEPVMPPASQEDQPEALSEQRPAGFDAQDANTVDQPASIPDMQEETAPDLPLHEPDAEAVDQADGRGDQAHAADVPGVEDAAASDDQQAENEVREPVGQELDSEPEQGAKDPEPHVEATSKPQYDMSLGSHNEDVLKKPSMILGENSTATLTLSFTPKIGEKGETDAYVVMSDYFKWANEPGSGSNYEVVEKMGKNGLKIRFKAPTNPDKPDTVIVSFSVELDKESISKEQMEQWREGTWNPNEGQIVFYYGPKPFESGDYDPDNLVQPDVGLVCAPKIHLKNYESVIRQLTWTAHSTGPYFATNRRLMTMDAGYGSYSGIGLQYLDFSYGSSSGVDPFTYGPIVPKALEVTAPDKLKFHERPTIWGSDTFELSNNNKKIRVNNTQTAGGFYLYVIPEDPKVHESKVYAPESTLLDVGVYKFKVGYELHGVWNEDMTLENGTTTRYVKEIDFEKIKEETGNDWVKAPYIEVKEGRGDNWSLGVLGGPDNRDGGILYADPGIVVEGGEYRGVQLRRNLPSVYNPDSTVNETRRPTVLPDNNGEGFSIETTIDPKIGLTEFKLDNERWGTLEDFDGERSPYVDIEKVTVGTSNGKSIDIKVDSNKEAKIKPDLKEGESITSASVKFKKMMPTAKYSLNNWILKVPADAQPGTLYPVTTTFKDGKGDVIYTVTGHVKVKEPPCPTWDQTHTFQYEDIKPTDGKTTSTEPNTHTLTVRHDKDYEIGRVELSIAGAVSSESENRGYEPEESTGQVYELSKKVTLHPSAGTGAWSLKAWRVPRAEVAAAANERRAPNVIPVEMTIPAVDQVSERSVDITKLEGWNGSADDILVYGYRLTSHEPVVIKKSDDPQNFVSWTTSALAFNPLSGNFNATARLGYGARTYVGYEKCTCVGGTHASGGGYVNTLNGSGYFGEYIMPYSRNSSIHSEKFDGNVRQGQPVKLKFKYAPTVIKGAASRWWSAGDEVLYLKIPQPWIVSPIAGTGSLDGVVDPESKMVTVDGSTYFKISNKGRARYKDFEENPQYDTTMSWDVELDFYVSPTAPAGSGSSTAFVTDPIMYFNSTANRWHTGEDGVRTIIFPYVSHGAPGYGSLESIEFDRKDAEASADDPLNFNPKTADNLRADWAFTYWGSVRSGVQIDATVGVFVNSGYSLGGDAYSFSPVDIVARPHEEKGLAISVGFKAGSSPVEKAETVLALPRKGEKGFGKETSSTTQLLEGPGVMLQDIDGNPKDTRYFTYSEDGLNYFTKDAWAANHQGVANPWNLVRYVKISFDSIPGGKNFLAAFPTKTEASVGNRGSWTAGSESASFATARAEAQNVSASTAASSFTYVPNVITGVAWNDVDANGMKDAGEKFAGGTNMVLKTAGQDEIFATTNVRGEYVFKTVAYEDLTVESPLSGGRGVGKVGDFTKNDFRANKDGTAAVNARGVSNPLTGDVADLDLGLTGIGFTIDYVRERIVVEGADGLTGDVKFFKDGRPIVGDDGSPITEKIIDGAITLTEALDAAGVDDAKMIEARVEIGGKTYAIEAPHRPAAPRLEATPAFGAGAMGAVTVTDPAASERYEFMHKDDGKWAVGETSAEHAGLEDVQARVAADNARGAENFHGFASKITVPQYRQVRWNVRLDGADGPLDADAADKIVGEVLDNKGQVSYGEKFLETVNSGKKVTDGVFWQDSAKNPEFPNFAKDGAAVGGTWETPGYDVIKVTAKKSGTAKGLLSFLSTGEKTIIDTKDEFYTARDKSADWDALGADKSGDLEVTLTIKMRSYDVNWSVEFADGIADKTIVAKDEKGNPLLGLDKQPIEVSGPTRQKDIRWDQKVRTRLLSAKPGTPDEYWNPADAAWVGQWFDMTDATQIPNQGDGTHAWPVGPELMGPADTNLMREPWRMRGNDGKSFQTFQVAEPLSGFSRIAPAEFMQAGKPGRAATSWRDADQVTFGVVYSKSEGAYAIAFGISTDDYANGDGYINGNGTQYRTSLLSGDQNFNFPTIRNKGTGEELAAPGVFQKSRTVLSGYFFDENGKGTQFGKGSDAEPLPRDGNARPDESPTTDYLWAMSSGDKVSREWNPAETVEGNLSRVWGKAYASVPDRTEGKLDTWPSRPVPDVDAKNSDGKTDKKPGFYTLPQKTSEVDRYSRAVLTARIEDASLATETRLPLALQTGYTADNAKGSIKLALANMIKLNATQSEYKKVDPSFVIGDPAFGAAKGDPAGWLIVSKSSDGEVSLAVKEGLPVGAYNGTISIPYTYTDTMGSEHAMPAVKVKVAVTVSKDGAVQVQGDWALSAHDYATLRSDATTELGTPAKIAYRTGLTLWSVSADGAWTRAGSWDESGAWVAGSLKDEPTLRSMPDSIDEGAGDETPVTFDVQVDGEKLSSVATVYLYDSGTPTLFAHRAETELAPLQEAVSRGNAEYTAWLRKLTGAIGYDSDDNWAEVVPGLDTDHDLSKATFDNTGSTYWVTWALRGIAKPVTADAPVKIIPSVAPAPAAPKQVYGDTTTSKIVWSSVEPTIKGAKVEYGVFRGNEVDLDSARPLFTTSEPVIKLFANGLSKDGLDSNGEYRVAARIAKGDKWNASRWAAATMWTRPDAPTVALDKIAFDYVEETISWKQDRPENGALVAISLWSDGARIEHDGLVSDLTAKKLDILAVGRGGSLLSSKGEVRVPSRAQAPTPKVEHALDDVDGRITGLEPGTEYEVVSGVTEHMVVDKLIADNSGSISRPDGVWKIRVAAKDGDWFASDVVEGLEIKRDWTIRYQSSNEDMGTVSIKKEVVGEISGDAKGSTATAAIDHEFFEWVDERGRVVSTDAHFVPRAIDGSYSTMTYTARFKLNDAAPAPSAPVQNIDATTDTILAWNAVEPPLPGSVVEYALFDGDADVDNDKPLASGDTLAGLTREGLDPNGRYRVAARVKKGDKWLASPWAWTEMWTRPTAPGMKADNVEFDYVEETATWAETRTEGDSPVIVSAAGVDLGGSVSELAGDKIVLSAVGGGGDQLAVTGEVAVPRRAEKPAPKIEHALDDIDGRITGLEPETVYDLVSTTPGNAVVDSLKADRDGSIARPDGAWKIRVAAKDGEWFASEVVEGLEIRRDWTLTYETLDEVMGTVDVASEVAGQVTGAAKGSTALPKEGFRFIGWFDAAGELVSTEVHFVPGSEDGVYTTATYRAQFAKVDNPEPPAPPALKPPVDSKPQPQKPKPFPMLPQTGDQALLVAGGLSAAGIVLLFAACLVRRDKERV